MAGVVCAFWSYSRTVEEYGGAHLHQAMSACLNDSLAPLQVELFRDNAEIGVPPGAFWPHDLAKAIGRSLLFFWVQSPRWLSRPPCLLEFDAFRDRVRRLAAQFSGVDEEGLWRLLVTPIHNFSMDRAQWQEMPDPVRRRIEQDWHSMQRSRYLDFDRLRRSRNAEIDVGHQCAAAVGAIKADLTEAARRLGRTLGELAALAANRDSQFETFWAGEFAKLMPVSGRADGGVNAPDAANLVARQRLAAQVFGPGQTSRGTPIGVTLVLLPGMATSAPFWASAGPLRGLPEVLVRIPDALRPIETWDGNHVWPADGVRAVLPALRRYRLELPDREIGDALREALQADPTTVERLGLNRWQGSFWTQNRVGELVACDGEGGEAHLVYVISRTSARHE